MMTSCLPPQEVLAVLLFEKIVDPYIGDLISQLGDQAIRDLFTSLLARLVVRDEGCQ
jgi:hypothetical protein